MCSALARLVHGPDSSIWSCELSRCSEDVPLEPSHIRSVSNVILLLLSDVLVHCAGCNRNIKSGDVCKITTPEEEKQAAGLLKNKGHLNLS